MGSLCLSPSIQGQIALASVNPNDVEQPRAPNGDLLYYPTEITDNVPVMWKSMIIWWTFLFLVGLSLAKDNPEYKQEDQQEETLLDQEELEESYF